MKPILTLTALCGLALSSLHSQAAEKSVTIQVSNPLSIDRTDEPVVISLSDIKTDFKIKSARVVMDGKEIPSQLDDLDGNGIYDELALVIDIKKKAKATLQLTLSSEKSNVKYAPRVYADMQMSDKNKKYPEIQILSFPGNVPASVTYGSVYHHGPEFESELTGYRIYFDNRQSLDIYGKEEHRLELATTRFYTSKEQRASGWGSDVLWAGKSVSVGSFRGWDGTNPLYVDSVALRTQAMRAYGPVRTIVDVIDKDWYYAGHELNMHQRYIQYAGHRDVEVQVSFDETLSGESFCTGVMKLPTDNKGLLTHDGLAVSWGTNQPEPKDPTLENVGLGVCVPQAYIRQPLEDDTNYLYILGNDGGHRISYHLTFCAAKEKQGYHSASEWIEASKTWQRLLNNPLKVTVE